MYSLLVMTLSGSVLALLLVCLRYTVLRKMPSTVYYYAWLLVLLRFALPLPGLIPTSSEKADNHVPVSAVYNEVNDREYVHGIVPENVQAFPVTGQDHVTENVSDRSTEPAETQIVHNAVDTEEMNVTEAAPEASFSIDWKSPKLWLCIWAAGAAVSLAVTVFSYLKFSSGLKRNLMEPDSFTKAVYASIPGRKPALYFSDSGRPPMMLGIFRPKIVLPVREYNEELLTNILRHELTHYRRFDMLYKWISVAILAIHWFNPITWFIRRELNRACEMSCDEMLLSSMNKEEKQSYGNTLLLMAASTALPSAVVATTFATEKRNLKERLNQIMNYKKSRTRMLAAFLAVVLLTGCGMAAGPLSGKTAEEETAANVTDAEISGFASENDSATRVTAPEAVDGVIKVKNVDELLASIAPNTVIELSEGVYDLSKASDYAKYSQSKYYSWNSFGEEDGKSAELVINEVRNLTIRGAGAGKTTIVAVPRDANVIVFDKCDNLTVSDLTAGHTEKTTNPCSGGVLQMQSCFNVNVDKCGLYGCGTIGVIGYSCEKLNVTNCDIYECSVGAIKVSACQDVIISSCDIHHHGTRTANSIAEHLFNVIESTAFTVYNCMIHDNRIDGLLYNRNSDQVSLLSNKIAKNEINDVFIFEQNGAIVDGCSFEDNKIRNWYKDDAKILATDLKGNKLNSTDFYAMKLNDIKPETVVPIATPTPFLKAKEVAPGTEITVKTIEDFLNAIGPDRTVVLDGTSFVLSDAKTYGGIGSEYYIWEERGDGYALVIHDVKNLTIKAKDPDPSKTTLETLPRYSAVLTFSYCENVTVNGFTAGHTKEKGECSGGVLDFHNCKEIKVEKMRLYGCGTWGIEYWDGSDLDVINTEIYECSMGGVYSDRAKGINFKDCNIHDIQSPALALRECENATWNGQKLNGAYLNFDVKPDGTLIPINDM